MFQLTEIVKDGILEVRFSNEDTETKTYQITNNLGEILMQGKITGNTQRSCLYVGNLKKGNYEFSLGKDHVQAFSIK